MKKFTSPQMRTAAKLHHLYSLMEKHADTDLMDKFSLSYMQALIMNIVRHHPNTTQQFLGICTRFTPGAISRQVEVLREKGMITRKVKKDNRREHEIALTKKGAEEVEKAFNELQKNLSDLFSVLKEKEFTQLENHITKLITKIDPENCTFKD